MTARVDRGRTEQYSIYLGFSKAFDVVSYKSLTTPQAIPVEAGWADTEVDWKQAEWLGPEGGDEQCNV